MTSDLVLSNRARVVTSFRVLAIRRASVLCSFGTRLSCSDEVESFFQRLAMDRLILRSTRGKVTGGSENRVWVMGKPAVRGFSSNGMDTCFSSVPGREGRG